MLTTTSQLNENVRTFLKRSSWKEVTLEEEGLDCGDRRGCVGDVDEATNFWTAISVSNTYISVDERLFWPYATKVLRSENYCYV